MPPQRVRPDGTVVDSIRVPYQFSDMPLLTHDETGAASMARASTVALVDRPAALPGGPGAAPKDSARRSSRWRRARRWSLALLLVAVLAPLLAFVIGWMIFKVPTADDATITQVATFTFADGVAPIAVVRPENVNRVKVTLDHVPEHVRQAVLAAEDRSFYSNPGFDITGIARAIHNQLTGGVGGGSTITQQYIKVSTGQDDFSLWRKYKEVVLAVKISREQTKDDILENYLNTIYMGRGAYGIQAASQVYYGKNVEDLTVSEGAMLAGIIQSPSNWDPAKNPDQSQRRWSFVLDGMAEQRWITPSERAEQRFPEDWLREPPALVGVPDDDRYHIYEKAVEELAAHGITRQQIDTDGLTVTTTVQPDRQRQAVEAVTSALKGQPGNLRSALVSVDPRTGAILAYYGGSNGLGTDYAEALRQPGSSFKPFVLAAALQGPEGVGLGSVYDGSSPQTLAGTVVNNSEGYDCTQCTVKTAMTRSVNTVFYQLALDVGTRKVIDAAHQAGIPGDLLPDPRGGIALGDQEVHPIDMASAFATFAADGMRHEPFIVSKVVAADGRVLFDRGEPTGEQTVPPQVARNVTESMLDVAASSRIALSGGRPVAAKTGTVQLEGTDDNKDAWTVGYTPSLSTAVWVGSDRSDPIKNAAGRPIYGRMLPGSIWRDFMNDALRGEPEEQFSTFVPIGKPPVVEYPSDETGTGSGTGGTPPAPQFGVPPDLDGVPGGIDLRDLGAGGFGGPGGDNPDAGDGRRGSGDGNPRPNNPFIPPGLIPNLGGRGGGNTPTSGERPQSRTLPAAAAGQTPAPDVGQTV